MATNTIQENSEERAVRLYYRNQGAGKVGDLAEHDRKIGDLLAVVRQRLEQVEAIYQEKGPYPVSWDFKLALDDLQTGMDHLREAV